jgi:tetratricopeptide (TPR) repeat protein
MRRVALLVLLAMVIASCATNRDVGRRYRAERDFMRADWEFQNLSIRPGDVGEDRWAALARRFEAIADRYGAESAAGEASPVRQEIRAVAARALFAAARIHADLGDSNRVEALYDRMAVDFSNLPEVAAEVALIRGGIAERRGDRLAAAALYQGVVDQVAPEAGATGAAGMVLELPLQIARLRAHDATGESRADAYVSARAYYERLAQDPAGGVIPVDAQVRLAQVAGDLGRWDEATAILQRLEAHLRSLKDPPRPPADIRFAIYGVQSRAGVDLELSRQTLTSLLEDYPDTVAIAPQVLLALASNASRRGRIDEALANLDRIVAEWSDKNAGAASHALLTKGRLLENQGRWTDALTTFRAVATQFPLSEAALQAPLEIVLHYARLSDAEAAKGDAEAAKSDVEATKTALSQAESGYREFVSRFPPGRLTAIARANLARVLALQDKHDAAVTELVRLGDDLAGSSQGAVLLLEAARIAFTDLGDTARAIGILDHAGEVYARTGSGRWAVTEAARLREAMAS